MRRLFSVILVLLFSLPLIAPALALTGGPGSGLLACCRKNGVHQCEMTAEQRAAITKGTSVSAPCRHCPQLPAAVSPLSHFHLAAPSAAAVFAEIVSHPALHRQTEARARVALDRSRHKRGPPSISL